MPSLFNEIESYTTENQSLENEIVEGAKFSGLFDEIESYAVPEVEEPERGFLGDIASHTARGLVSLAEHGTQGIKTLTGGAIGDDASKYLKKLPETTPFLRPDASEVRGEGIIKRGGMGALESAPMTGAVFAGAYGGAKVGALVGGPVGAVVGGFLGSGATMLGLFGAGTYGRRKDEVTKELTENKPGLSDEQISEMSHANALTHAKAEVFGESIADAAAYLIFSRVPGGKIAYKGGKAMLKDLAVPSAIKAIGLGVAKAMPFEVGSEVWTAYAQHKADEKIGIEKGTALENMGEAIVPAMFLTGGMGVGIGGYNAYQRKAAYNAINSKKQGERVAAIEAVAGNIAQSTGEKEVAQKWYKVAMQYVEDGQAVPVDVGFSEFIAEEEAHSKGLKFQDMPAEDKTAPTTESRPSAARDTLLNEDEQDVTAKELLTGEKEVIPEESETFAGAESLDAEEAAAAISDEQLEDNIAVVEPEGPTAPKWLDDLTDTEISKRIDNFESTQAARGLSEKQTQNLGMLQQELENRGLPAQEAKTETEGDREKAVKEPTPTPEKTKVALEEVGVEIPDFKTTGEAYAFGEKATPEQVKELQRLVKVQDTKFNELKKAGKLQEAMDEAIKHQFYNEALQKVEGTEQYKKFKPEPKEVPKTGTETEKKVKKVSLDSLEYRESGDAVGKEYHGRIAAHNPKTKKEVGHIDYSYADNETAIRMIGVEPEYRRQGIGTKLLEKLQEDSKSPIKIQGTFATKEGKALFEKFEGAKPQPPKLPKAKPTEAVTEEIKGEVIPEVKPKVEKEKVEVTKEDIEAFIKPLHHKYYLEGQNKGIAVEKLNAYGALQINKLVGSKLRANVDMDAVKQYLKEHPTKVEVTKKAGVEVTPEKKIAQVPTKSLSLDPTRFQFKRFLGKGGVSSTLKSISKYNPDLGGIISVWRDPSDNKTYVVNGHHRYELAKRTGQKDLTVNYLDAANAGEAKFTGALINIAEGQGTPEDAAVIFRKNNVTPEEIEKKYGISLKGKIAQEGMALSGLSPEIFEKVELGEFSRNWGVVIGEKLRNDFGAQNELAKLIKREGKKKHISTGIIEQIINDIQGIEKRTETQETLFGDEIKTRPLLIERAELRDYAINKLLSDKRLFGIVSKEEKATRLRKAGNIITPEENKKLSEEAGKLATVLNQLASHKGPINDTINEYAKELANGINKTQRDATKQSFFESVQDAIRQEVPGIQKEDHKASVRYGEGREADTGKTPEQVEGFKPKPKLLGGDELIPKVKSAEKTKLAALDKVERQATSKFEQDSMFEPNQQSLFGKPAEKAIPPRPLVNPKASALKQDKQLRAQQAWDKKYGEKPTDEKEPSGVRDEKAFATKEEIDTDAIKERGIKGDALLDVIDIIDEAKSHDKTIEIDKEGYVTLYHRTTKANADNIKKTGYMTTKEPGLFFGSKPTGQIDGYGDTVVKVRIPIEKLELNDIFTNEVHFRLSKAMPGKKYKIEVLDEKAFATKATKPQDTITRKYETAKDIKSFITTNYGTKFTTAREKLKGGHTYTEVTPDGKLLKSRIQLAKNSQNDIGTILHEFGHLIDEAHEDNLYRRMFRAEGLNAMSPELPQYSKTYANEMSEIRKVGVERGVLKEHMEESSEAIAEFVRVFSVDRNLAQKLAPQTTASFEKVITQDKKLADFFGEGKQFATTSKPQDTITRKDLRKIFKRMKHIRTGQDSDGNLWFKAEGRPKITIFELDNITGHLNTSAGQIPVGSYLRDTIELKTGGEGHTADIGTAYHEFFHWLSKNGFISANDIAALNRVIAKIKGISESNVTEEHRAYYVGDNISAWETQKHPRIRRILRKLADFMRAIYDFAAQSGWVAERERTAEHVLRDIESGKVLGEKAEAVETMGVLSPAYQKSAARWYSQVVKAIEKFPSKMGARSVLNWFKKQPNVKTVELEWMGLEEFLEDKKVVTKVELAEFLRANQVEVREVEKGKVRELTKVGTSDPDIFDVADMNIGLTVFTGSSKEADTYIKNKGGDTKFVQWQLPGGENYKELLLTLPLKQRIAKVKTTHAPDTEVRVVDESQTFRSPHYDEPNILAHVRFNERTDAEGNKVLFLEEAQSDWALKGRQEGYALPMKPEDARKKVIEINQRVKDGELTREEAIPLIETYTKKISTVPDMPFKENWYQVALKRMLRYASENGFDKLAWITGEQTADRYDLSKQINIVQWDHNADGTFDISAIPKNLAAEPIEKKGISRNELENLIGKEITGKIVDHKGQTYEAPDGATAGELKGLDLKIGGEWATQLYDKMIPQYLKKFGKKWDAKVGTVELPGVIIKPGPIRRNFDIVVDRSEAKENYKVYSGVFSEGTQELLSEGLKSKEEAVSFIDNYIKERPPKIAKVQFVNITPEMKQSALREGMPLFQMAGTKAIGAPTGQLVKAQEMLAEGKDKKEVWRETGWLFSKEGKWKFEVDDSGAKLKDLGLGKQIHKLGDVLDHPKLYEAYPKLKEIRVHSNMDTKDNWTSGSYFHGEGLEGEILSRNRIMLDGNPNKAMEYIHHEVAHAVQNIEGFAKGGSPNVADMTQKLWAFYEDKALQYNKMQGSAKKVQLRQTLDKLKRELIDKKTPDPSYILKAYQNLAGEIEARDVSARAKLTPEQRREQMPYESQGIPEDQWIITDGKGTSFSVSEQKAFSVKGDDQAGPSFQETLEPVTQEDYIANRKTNKNIKLTIITNTKRVASEIVEGVDKFLGAISTRLGNVSPRLRDKLRKLDFDISTKYAKDVKKVEPLLRKAKKMALDDIIDWDYARKNSDIARIHELVSKYSMQEEYAAYREALGKVRGEGLDVGLEIGEIKEYAPRILKDQRGFLKAIGKSEYRPLYSDKLKERADDLGITVESMHPDMKADIISNIILGGWTGLGGVPATKHRVLKKIPADLNKYYMDSDAALMQHLYSMRKLIEAQKFFGKIPKKVGEMRKRLYAVQTLARTLNSNMGGKLSKGQINEMARLKKSIKDGKLDDKQTATAKRTIRALENVSTDTMPDEQIATIRKNRNKYIGLEKEYTAYIAKYALQRDYTENIGAYIIELIENKEISPKHEQVVNEILSARFHEHGTHGVIQAYKNMSYIDTMGSPISALTQIGDFAWPLFEYGVPATLKHAYRSVVGKPKITRADVGVDRIAQEFADSGALGDAVSIVFKMVGLEQIDAIGKETLLNAALEDYQNQAKNNPTKLKREIKSIFEAETDSVIDDLVNDEISDNVKLLTYSKLLDFQPVGLSEMTQQYLTAGNGRLFYMLKTFTLKQFDIFRRISYNKIVRGNKAEKLQGVKNLIKLSMLFVLANAGADELKDWVLGRKTDFKDRMVDNILRLFGVSKFVTWKARTEGVGSALARQILPPFKFIDSAGKDIITAGDEKGLEVIGSIPVIGKLAYWHMGRGRSKREDLWNRRLRKRKSKLNKIKDRFDIAKDKRAFEGKHRNELSELRRINRLQGRLNKKRERINKLKRLQETVVRKKEIQRLEVERTNMIKKFLTAER